MSPRLAELLRSYDPGAPLERAWTLPSAFYLDEAVLAAERATVFSRSWQVVGRAAQVQQAGQYLCAEVAGEPIVVVRGRDTELRAFYNVCRHHAARVMTAPEGQAASLRCPYHGWTYALDGKLLGTPDFAGVFAFEREDNGLVPVAVDTWGPWVLVRLEDGPSLAEFLGEDLRERIAGLDLGPFRFAERRRYELRCNWKVYVDNYLDGGYHVPHLHKGLGSVLDYSRYAIDLGARHCLQHSPITAAHAEGPERDTRAGDEARYFWIYPNFMINAYEGVLDTNLVRPLAVDRTEVIFDFYFTDLSPEAAARNQQSMAVSERIQDEDVGICESVQRGLASRAYLDRPGRLSARREGGMHLFHRLLHADLASL